MNPLPRRVSLQQAAVWAVKGEEPIDEGPFTLLGQVLLEEELRAEGRLRTLWHSLVQGKLHAWGYLGFRGAGDRTVHVVSADHQTIAPWDWAFPAIDWNRSTLQMDWDDDPSRRLRHSTPSGWAVSHLDDEVTFPAEFFWTSIEVDTAKLMLHVPAPTAQDRTAPRQLTHAGGRPPKFDWHELYSELVAIAASGKLPKKQSACEQLMLDWCSENWGCEPSISVLRTHVARVYSRLREGR